MEILQSSHRDCPKSLVGARGIALKIAQQALFDPFRLPHSVPIHLRGVAKTPFRTVSEGEFSEVQLHVGGCPDPLSWIETSVTFLWYGGVAGDDLRSVGDEALPSSKSVCSILPIAICGPGLLGLRPL